MTSPVKHYFYCVLVFLLLLIISKITYAASVEVHSGLGNIGGASIGDCGTSGCPARVHGSFKQTDVNAVFNASRRMDIFIGAEYTESLNATQDHGGIYDDWNMNYSFRITAATFGLRLKPVVSDKWHIYLALGGIAGQTHYTAHFGDQLDLIPLSGAEGTSYFIHGRFGGGAIIGLSKRLGVAIEGAMTQSPPTFNVMVLNNNTGQVEKKRLSDRATMFGITVGLRYEFGE